MNHLVLGAANIRIEGLDIVVLVLYFVVIIGVGLWAGLKRRGETESKGYFLAGSTLTWPLIGMALFSTNISTIHMVGFAEEGYVNGLAHGNFEWMAPFLLIVLSFFFAPFYLRSRVATLPDFLEQRFSRSCRDWLAALSIVSAVFIHIGFCLYTGAVVLKGLFGIPIMTSVVVAAGLTGLYTIIGGLLAVVVTGAMQTVILLVGAIVITIIAMHRVGGWEGLATSVEPVKLTVLRSADDPAHLPWYSVFLGYPVIGLWYWCADQTIVQRVLGAKDENHARVGPLFCGFLKILPVFIFFLPGTVYLALANQGVFEHLESSKDCYALTITNLLPAGLTGLMAAALLAALMSTVSGALNSIATLFAFDLYARWRPDTPDHKLVRIGQLATLAGMLLAILWSPFVARFPTIYQGSNAVICYLAPPITAVFIFGIFWRRASARAALTTLISGSVLGILVFVVDWYSDKTPGLVTAPAEWLAALFHFELSPRFYAGTGWDTPFMMSGFYLFVVCCGVMFVTSWLRPHVHTAASEKLVWKSPLEAIRWQGWKGIGDYRILAGILFFAMVGFYIVFNRLHARPAENPSDVVAGLQARYYAGDWQKPSDCNESVMPTRIWVADRLVPESLDEEQGGLVVFTGFLEVPREAKYIFYTESTDECYLYLGKIRLDLRSDQEEGAQDDGTDGLQRKKGGITLAKGRHAIRVLYHRRALAEQLVSGSVEIPARGLYHLSMKSGEGKDLPIGADPLGLQAGKVVVSARIKPERKPIHLRILYEGPGIEKTEIPPEVLFRKR